MGGIGLEPTALALSRTPILIEASAKSGALGSGFDPDLRFIVDQWLNVPAELRERVVAMFKQATKKVDPEHRREALRDAWKAAHDKDEE